ncbi:MAG: Ig-like domain-containing protein [Candidatus Bathyarchaeia archaeon]
MKFHNALFWGICFLLLAALFFSFPVFPAANVELSSSAELSQNFSHIILFSWDGVQYERLIQLLDTGQMPVLQGIISQGVFVKAIITDHQTITSPGHECLLSGRGGYEQIPDNQSVWENLKAVFGNEWKTGAINGKSKLDTVFQNARDAIDYYYSGDHYAADAAEKAIQFVHNYSSSSFFLFVHFRDPDSAGHAYGENSQEYSDAIIESDTQVGMVMSALESKGILNSTAIIVSTDHGFKEGGTDHGSNPWPEGDPHCYTIFIASSQGTVEPAEWSWDQNDVAPTIYSLAGISDYQSRWSYLKGLALWDRTSGPTPPEIPFTMDGELDSQALLLAETPNNTQQRHLWTAVNGTFLYVATDIAGSYDVFILISQQPGTLQASPWAKKGQVAKYDYYLAEEQSNEWTGWFKYHDEHVYSGVRISLGSVLEGVINLEEAFTEVPPELCLAAVAYQTPNGGKLVEQVPPGNGDVDVNSEEFMCISIDAIPPVVTFISPLKTFLGGTVEVTVGAADDGEVGKVEFYVDNNRLFTDQKPPFTWMWDTKSVSEGNHVLIAKAYDFCWNSAEKSITITVDNISPTASIVVPSDGTKLSGVVDVSFNASDLNLENVTLHMADRSFVVTGQNSFEWDTTTFPDGNYTIRLVAFDKAGNKAEDQVTVVIKNAKAIPIEIIVGGAATILIATVVAYLVLKKR